MRSEIIKDLFSHEESQQKKLEKAKETFSKRIDTERTGSEKRIEAKKRELAAEIAKAVELSKSKALSDVKALQTKQSKRIDDLEKTSKKNFNNAVNTLLQALLKS